MTIKNRSNSSTNTINKWLNNIIVAIGEFQSTLNGEQLLKSQRIAFSIQERTKSLKKATTQSENPNTLIKYIEIIIKRLESLEEIVGEQQNNPNTGTFKALYPILNLATEGRTINEKLKAHIEATNSSSLIQAGAIDEQLRELRSKLKDATSSIQQNEVDSKSISRDLIEIKTQYEALTTNINNINKDISKAVSQKISEAEITLSQLKEKEDEVNNLVGIISGKSIAGSYGASAQEELRWANATRNGSVFLMLFIAIIVGYSLLETANPNFDWKTSIFRLVFSVALSVPAAYLSRESTKHRTKQHEYLQMSLNLQSIAPYIASLPDTEQHKLKSEMAVRLFGSNTQTSSSESYPVDIQALLLKIVDKIPNGVGGKSSVNQEESAK